jgi:hemerythrin superfamily protein
VDAIKLLTLQHREVEALFEELESARERAHDEREQLCRKITTALAVHAAIEQRIFYPAIEEFSAGSLPGESLEEQLCAERLIAGLVVARADDERFDAKMNVLKEAVEHHAKDEEKGVFTTAQRLLGADRLRALGAEMERLADALNAPDAPRMSGENDAEPLAPM